jgi:hypothetical protein
MDEYPAIYVHVYGASCYIRLEVLDVNGSLHVPFMMSSTDKFLTTESIHREIKEQI